MKLGLLMSFSLLITLDGFCQAGKAPQLQWIKSFKGEQQDYAKQIILSSDGGYYLIGDSESTTQDFSFRTNSKQGGYVVKTDSNGFVQWKKSIFNESNDKAKGFCEAGIEVEDGVVLVGWSNCCDYLDIVKLNKQDGSILWVKSYNENWIIGPQNIVQTANGLIISGEVMENSKRSLALLYLNKNGNIISTSKIENFELTGNRGVNSHNKMQFDNSGNILISGNTIPSNETGCKLNTNFTFRSDVRLIKLSQNFQILWDKTYSADSYDQIYDLAITSIGDIILLGSSCYDNGSKFGPFNVSDETWLMHLDSEGRFKNIKGTSFLNVAGAILSISLTCDDNVILCTGDYENGVLYPTIIKTDTDLKNLFWRSKDAIKTSNSYFVKDAIIDSRGDLVVLSDGGLEMYGIDLIKFKSECNQPSSGTPIVPNVILQSDIVADPNMTIKLPITTSNFKDVASIQFSLKVNNPLLVSIIGIEKAAIDPKFNLVSSDLIGINWTSNQSYNTFKDGEIMFYLLLRTNNFSGVTDIITSNTPNIPQSNVLFNGQKTQSSLNVSQGTVHINQLSNNLRLILSRHMAKQGEEVYVSLSSYKFQGVTNMDFTLGYDTNVIKFVRFEAPPNNLLNMGPGNFEANLFPAKITSTWQSGGGGNQGITVPDGTVLGKLIFKVLPNTLNKKSDIIFLNDPLPVSIYAENKKVQVDTTNGYIYVSTISDSKDYSDNDFQLLPNPFYNSVTIVSNKIISNTKFQLFDSKGTLILHLDNLSNTKIEIPDYLPNGLYYYRLIFKDTNTSQTGKLIKNN